MPPGMSLSVGRFENEVPAVLPSGWMFEQSSGQALAVVKALWDTKFVCFVFSILAAGFSGAQVA